MVLAFCAMIPNIIPQTIENATPQLPNITYPVSYTHLDVYKRQVFNLVPTRKAAKLVVKALKAGKNTVDLTGEASGPDDKTEENA